MILNTTIPPTPVKYVPAPTRSYGAFAPVYANKMLIGDIWVQDYGAVKSSMDLNNWNNSARLQQSLGKDVFLPYNGNASLITFPEEPDIP